MAKNITLTLARGIEIFTALGRRTAKNWKVLQLTNAINVGLATIATDEVLAAIKDPAIVADIKGLLKADAIDIVETETAAAAAPVAEAPAAKKAPAKKAPVAPAAAPVAEAPPAKAPAKKGAAKKAPVAPAETLADVAVAVAVDTVAAKAPAKKGAAKKAPVAPAEPPAPVAEPAPATTKKGAAKKAPAPPAAAAAPVAEAKSKCVGVRYTAGRPFVCGQVLLEYGVLNGVTPEMVAAVDAQYGDANPRESMFAIRNGWHVLRGYMGWETAEAMAASHDMAVEAMPVCVGARFGLTRPYFAGVVLAAFGIQNGVTQEMINAVEAYMPDDAKNPRETGFALRNGWHILRGYFGVETDAQAEARDAERAAA